MGALYTRSSKILNTIQSMKPRTNVRPRVLSHDNKAPPRLLEVHLPVAGRRILACLRVEHYSRHPKLEGRTTIRRSLLDFSFTWKKMPTFNADPRQYWKVPHDQLLRSESICMEARL